MIKLDPTTCEECLALLTGIAIPKPQVSKLEDTGFSINKNDSNILCSIAKQLSKGIAMTDRQYALVKSKLAEYEDQFDYHGIDVIEVSNNLMYELREIDRSHWIKVLKWKDEDVLGIRFPFNKKIISRIEDLRKLSHVKDLAFKDNTHYFPFNAQNIFALVEIANRFDSKFSIQSDIIDIYNQLKEYNDNKEQYVPGIYNNQIKNIPQVAIDNLEKELGNVSDDNLLLYYDRRYLYGLHSFDQDQLNYVKTNYSNLVNKIVDRTSSAIIVKKESYTFDQIFESLLDLKRLPMLIVLSENNAHDALVETFNSVRHSISSEDISVCFRNDGQEDPFNEYVKNNNLNNSVAFNTKIVYINNTKLPKPLLKSDWIPNSVFSYNKGLTYNKVVQFTQQFDLQIIYEDPNSIGYWNRTSRRHISANV